VSKPACTACSPTPVPSTTSPTTLPARTSADTFCAMSSESARQWVILMKGYFLPNRSVIGRNAWFTIMAE
jgi:hypothetical protein